jgi:hypothetical protein
VPTAKATQAMPTTGEHTARRLWLAPHLAGDLDPVALATLDELGLVARHGRHVRLNIALHPRQAFNALGRGDYERAKSYARPRIG